MKTHIKKISLAFMLLVLQGSFVLAQDVETDFQNRLFFEMEFKPIKKLKLTITPEVRLNESFSVSKYLLEAEASYKIIKHVYLGANYRFVVNPRDEKSTEYGHRFGFSAKYKYKFNDLKSSFRLAYSNYADDYSDLDKAENYLRYKLALKYDIPKCKLTPSVSAELFHSLDGGDLYKMRYKLGLDYKLFKNNYLNANYKFDYYINEYKNRHIFTLGYKLNF